MPTFPEYMDFEQLYGITPDENIEHIKESLRKELNREPTECEVDGWLPEYIR